MILFPNAKINLGLNVINRRPDGYHDLLTVMFPVSWCDILEIVPSRTSETTLTTLGRPVACPPEKNLVMKAYRALYDEVGGIPPVEIYLNKIIPDGAGLGGGSSDAASTIKGLNELFNLDLTEEQMAKVATKVGADCPFFIYNRPSYCTGTGTEIYPDIYHEMNGTYIAIAKPKSGSISTAEAYAGITPRQAENTPSDIIHVPPLYWKGALVNDFEAIVFARLPRCRELKEHFYAQGADYSSMSGSGSAVYGIFYNDKMAQDAIASLNDCDTFTGKLC